jgi:hypothetical protein
MFAFSISAVQTQHDDHPAPPARSGEPMPLYPGILGDFARPITTSSEEAQAYFDQGMRLRYAFASADAARSFREAQLRDPNCAMPTQPFSALWTWQKAMPRQSNRP